MKSKKEEKPRNYRNNNSSEYIDIKDINLNNIISKPISSISL